MSDANVVTLREDSSDLQTQLEQRRSQARNLELQVARKGAELQRAKEEQALLKELRTVNEVTLRKKQQRDGTEDWRPLKISAESLAEVIALEDEIKEENRRTTELKESANTISRQMESVEHGIENVLSRMALVKDVARWNREETGALGGAVATNEWILRKRSLTALNEEQKKVKALSALLSERIEAINKEMEEHEQKQEQLAVAQRDLVEANDKYGKLIEELKSAERLIKKKERMLDANVNKECNEYKKVKQLDGDKKVLYGTLSKFRESNVNNSKSILSLEVRLRQLETKLEAVNLFVQQVFAQVEEEELMDDIPEDATEVSLEQFEEICRDVELARETLIQRENQLNAHDAKVEQLGRKMLILQNAIASRATSAQLQIKGNEKEFETLISHVDYMKAEFDEEYKKLSQENAMLQSKLGQRQ
ncbi:hypothetical protein TraAM80_07388 [Trypanosoma rangeli]|uniref:Uncharacterized protein n=1 Tax=Trypanosoma rangeli TaxID=5698 RepID=A0A422N5Q1_TRYRA|nr:uncharacterized protein TraAM80_07388 [Trypanosoma rangeli]RNF00804.1 hypothetical protein TraAM80_07388 [Trypanosoma rangeli]|eukprot:RNF00804.1 hypothetical protein TraAM80_07388 [Trypanosoma rangeli]